MNLTAGKYSVCVYSVFTQWFLNQSTMIGTPPALLALFIPRKYLQMCFFFNHNSVRPMWLFVPSFFLFLWRSRDISFPALTPDQHGQQFLISLFSFPGVCSCFIVSQTQISCALADIQKIPCRNVFYSVASVILIMAKIPNAHIWHPFLSLSDLPG